MEVNLLKFNFQTMLKIENCQYEDSKPDRGILDSEIAQVAIKNVIDDCFRRDPVMDGIQMFKSLTHSIITLYYGFQVNLNHDEWLNGQPGSVLIITLRRINNAAQNPNAQGNAQVVNENVALVEENPHPDNGAGIVDEPAEPKKIFVRITRDTIDQIYEIYIHMRCVGVGSELSLIIENNVTHLFSNPVTNQRYIAAFIRDFLETFNKWFEKLDNGGRVPRYKNKYFKL